MKLTIEISKDQLIKMGNNSIHGMLVSQDEFEDFLEADEQIVVISFEETPYGWRKMNGGPEEVIVTEDLFAFIAEDILKLQNAFDDVRIKRNMQRP
jgi:hypothetical protein